MFGKVETKIWDSLRRLGLNDQQKLAFIYLLSNKHTNPLGYYVLPLAYMAEDLHWSLDKTRKAVKVLERHGLVAYDSSVRVMWIINYLDYHTIKKNQTENSSLVTLQETPLSPLAKGLFAAVAKKYPGWKFTKHLHKLVSDPSLFGDSTVTGQTPDGVPSISTSTSNSISSSYPEDFEKFWTIFDNLGRAEGKPGVFENWNATIEGRNGARGHPPFSADQLIAAAKNYRDFCVASNTERKYIMLPASFLGPKRRGWEGYLKPVESQEDKDMAYTRKILDKGRDETT